jgi:hypothetical protein
LSTRCRRRPVSARRPAAIAAVRVVGVLVVVVMRCAPGGGRLDGMGVSEVAAGMTVVPLWGFRAARIVRGRPSGLQGAARRGRDCPCGQPVTPEPLRPLEAGNAGRSRPAHRARGAACVRWQGSGSAGFLSGWVSVDRRGGAGASLTGDRGLLKCGHLFWPRLVGLSSSDLAPPSWVAVAGDGVSSSDLAPPLGE